VDRFHPDFPSYLYDRDPLNDLRAVNPKSVRWAMRAVSGRDYFGSSPADQDSADNAVRYRTFQSPGRMSALGRAIDRYRTVIDRPTRLSCADFPAVSQQLLPFARQTSRRGARLQVLIPPYALATWYDWRANTLRSSEFGASVFEDQMMLRRCIVLALADIPGVEIFAFDDNAALSGDLANYRDPAHIQSDVAISNMLADMSRGQGRLDRENVEAYLGRMRTLVKAYRLYNSRMNVTGLNSEGPGPDQ
jgi:hypothetical protein